MAIEVRFDSTRNRATWSNGRMTFGEKLDLLMRKHGHTQTELARLIGTQASSISGAIAGRQGLRLKQVLAIARLYGETVDCLIDDVRELGGDERGPGQHEGDEKLIWEMVRELGTREALDRLLMRKGKGSDPDRGQKPTTYEWGGMPKPTGDDNKSAKKRPG